MLIELFCPDCKDHTDHSVLRWQTVPNQFGAMSAMCGKCDRLTILSLDLGVVINFDEKGELVRNVSERK